MSRSHQLQNQEMGIRLKQRILNPLVMAIYFAGAMAMTPIRIPIMAETTVAKADWGKTPDHTAVELYTLKSGKIQVQLTTFGARIVSIRTPDRNSKLADIILGYNSLNEYVADTKTYFGGTVGRYANRIRGGRFTIDGHEYRIPPNNNGNALHGGPVGFDRWVWQSRKVADGVEMTLVSPDGDQGFPGTLTATVRYTLRGTALRMDYSATTDKPTVVNFTNHAFFNLHGNDADTILDHELTIYADHYTTEVAGLLPTGEVVSLAGTPLDFRKATAVGARIHEANDQLRLGNGYDNNWILNGETGRLHPAAKLADPVSGRTLTITTTEPGVEFYSGNFLDGSITGRHGVPYTQYKALCLETQHYADSPNQPDFPSTLLRPGETMRSTTIFTFGVE